MTFVAMNILRPLLSVGQLQRQGWNANFSAHSSLRRGDRVAPLLRRGNLTFMPAVLPANKEWPKSVKMIMAYAIDAIKDKKAETGDREPWHVMEYCCEKGSLLSEWFLTRTSRFGLPTSDRRTRHAAEDVVRRVEQALDKGERVLLWAALPCTPWSSWQHMNATLSVQTAERIELARQESLRMLRIFVDVVKRVLEVGGDRVAVAFEWPRGASGRQLAEMEELKSYLPHVCRFDGCQYGLTTVQGVVKTPWRVQTNVKELVEPLSP